MLIVGSTPLASSGGHTYRVSRHTHGWTRSFVCFFANYSFFPPAGETQCEIFFACKMGDARLIDFGLVRLIPVMISRMTISLKKVASMQEAYMSLEIPTGVPTNLQDTHSPRPTDNIRLSLLKS